MNRLGDSASLYLRQHADNPVHWQPWDEAALAQARERDVPVLLSVGYSACHWCHVMAHESFEDAQTAGLMNELFVNIKVDREERPDLDKLYQLAHQLMTGRGGGWPLTVFLEPHKLVPFFAGTYFPPAPRHGLLAFREVLRRVRDWFDRSRDEVLQLNANLSQAIAAIQQPGEAQRYDPAELLATAGKTALARHDRLHGGFGGAPKFPQAPLLAALPALERHDPALREARALPLVLERMSRGGLRDQLDGGFFRYTVDGDWTIPHFEKMLYDNAQLLPLYAAQRDSAWFAGVAEGIVAWLASELRQANGGFASSMDADAAGVEGGYHVWTPAQLQDELDAEQLQAAVSAFGLDLPANFEGSHWHLTRRGPDVDEAILQSAIGRMRELREQRQRPATDHKQLTAWNALCTEGLACAGLAMGRSDWLDMAAECLGFIRSRAWRDGVLYAVVADGRPAFPAYLDDHAFTLQASLSFLQARWDDGVYDFAIQLAERLLAQFEDPEHGGFFFTASEQQAPVQRLRVLQDDATPSGNGIAALALQRLGHLGGTLRYLDAVERLLDSAGAELQRYPLAHATLLRALDEWHAPPPQVIISGADRAEMAAWAASIRRHGRLNCYIVPAGSARHPGAVPPTTSGDRSCAWLCLGMRCLPRADSLEELERLLGEEVMR